MANILVADSQLVIRDAISYAIKQSGHSATSVADGKSALEAIHGQRPDLVVLELNLPGVSGFDVLELIRKDRAHAPLPVIVLTDVSEKASVLRAVELGIVQYILKSSFSMEKMMARIGSIVGGGAKPMVAPDGSVVEGGVRAGAIGGGAGALAGDESGAGAGGGAGGGASGASAGGVVLDPGMTHEQRHASLKEFKPLMSRSEVTAGIESYGDLQAMSPVSMEILKLTKKSSSTLEDITKLVRREPALAMKLLRLANSAAYSAEGSVESVDRAVMVIGMTTIGQAVMNVGVMENFSSIDDDSGIDIRQFWEHSIGVALLAARIAHKTEIMEPDAAFTMGLIHDVGRLVYLDIFADQYKQVMRVAHELELPMEVVESRLLLLNHAECMDKLLHAWKFPRDLIDPVVFHHLDPDDIKSKAGSRQGDVAILSLANALANLLTIGSGGNDFLYPMHDLCAMLKLNRGAVVEILDGIHDETDDLKLAMLMSSGGEAWESRTVQYQADLGADVRAMCIGPGFKEIELGRLISEIATPSDGPPNLAVLHLSKAADKAPLCSKVLSQEADAGASGLPLIVFSATKDLGPTDELAANRTVVQLVTPAPIARVIGVIQSLLGAGQVAAAA